MVACKLSLLGKYLAFNILEIRDEGEVWNLQTYLANIAKLKSLRDLKPMPPFCLGLNNFSFLNQWIFLLVLLLPHQKVHIALSILEHNPLDRRKQLIM